VQSGGSHGVRGPLEIDAPLMRCTTTEPHLATAETRHIALEVWIDGDVISGQAGDGTGRPRPFAGWLGLIGALHRLLANPTTDESR